MATYTVDRQFARLIGLGLDADMAEKITEWKDNLTAGRVTEEMRTVFYGMGYLSSMRDPRVQRTDEFDTKGDRIEVDIEAAPEKLGLDEVTTPEPRRRSKPGDDIAAEVPTEG